MLLRYLRRNLFIVTRFTITIEQLFERRLELGPIWYMYP